MNSWQSDLPNLQATLNFGKKLGESLPGGSTILLQGNLGAGKTSLIQGIGQGLGITEPIVSPTFTLINEYTEGRLPLYHLDLYRLQPEEVEGIYPEIYWEALEVTPGITAIEWSQRLPYQPDHYLEINLTSPSKGGRQVDLRIIGNSKLHRIASLITDNW